MVGAFQDIAFKTPVGDVSAIFKTQHGYHIFYCVSKSNQSIDRSIDQSYFYNQKSKTTVIGRKKSIRNRRRRGIAAKFNQIIIIK